MFSFDILTPEDEITMLSGIVRNESPSDVVTHPLRWLPFEFYAYLTVHHCDS